MSEFFCDISRIFVGFEFRVLLGMGEVAACIRFHLPQAEPTNIPGQGEESLCIANGRKLVSQWLFKVSGCFWTPYLCHPFSSFVYIHFFHHCKQLKPSIVVCHPPDRDIFQHLPASGQIACVKSNKCSASLFAHQNLRGESCHREV